MGTRYVVSVLRVDEVEGSSNQYDTRDTTLFEATMTDPSRLARFAPVEVLEALAAESGAEVVVDFSALAEPQPTDEAGRDDTPAPATEAPKRKRRTKAEIAADQAATEARLNGQPEPALAEAATAAADDMRDQAIRQTTHPTEATVFGLPPQGSASVEQHAATAEQVAAPVKTYEPQATPVFNPFQQ